MSKNGKAFILKDRANPLAHYPHMREAGGFLFVSGISARRPDGSIEGDEIRAQTRAVIENLKIILQVASADLTHLVDITTFLADMRDYPGYNEIYNDYFQAESGPARTTVAVKELPGKNLLIEIKAVALAPSNS